MNLETLTVPLKLDKQGFKFDIKDVATVVTAGTAAIAGAMALAVKATMDWAADLDSLGDVMDGTTEDMAAFAFVARKSGVGVETFAKANVLLEKGLLKADGQLDATGEKLKEYGINVKDSNGNVKDSVKLTDEIAEKYKSLATQQERVNFLTEIYGKNGAALVDFFDTLNSEGGISGVTKKVEALGLAIDPARYEQFNRNLEELKLIGLGLAVSFTEKVMPVLENLLGWLENKAPQAVEAFKKGGLSGLADWVIDELGKLDEQIASKLDKVDWSGLGTKFGDWIDKQLSGSVESAGNNLLPKFIVAFTDGLSDALIHAALGVDPKATWAAFFDNIQREGDSQVRTFFINWELSWSKSIRTFFDNIEIYFTNGFVQIINAVIGWLNKLDSLLPNGGMTLPTLPLLNPLGQPVGSPASVHTTTSSAGGGRNNKRATGGAVIAGQAYVVGERGIEKFVPNTSGRIDPMKTQTVEARINEALLGRIIGAEIAKALG